MLVKDIGTYSKKLLGNWLRRQLHVDEVEVL